MNLNGSWKIYTDPEWAVGKKRATEENRRLSGLKWSRSGFFTVKYYCDKRKKHVWKWATLDEVSNPNYDPWIYVTADKIWNDNDPNYLTESRGGYEFLCQPTTGVVYYRRIISKDLNMEAGFSKLKQGRKIHKTLIERIKGIEVGIYKRKNGSALSTGYFYAPYIPLLKTPTVLDPNSFTPNKSILGRYSKKLISPKYYGVVNVTNL